MGEAMRRSVLAWLVLLAVGSLSNVAARQALPPRLDNRVQKLTSGYLSNADLVKYLEDFNKRCSSISKVHTFGKSVGDVPLLALEISDKPGINTGKPEVKYVGNIHGDEPSGRQLLLLLAEVLCAEHKQAGSPAARVVSSIRLFLIPTLNPDGFASRTRENLNNVDLNRNFPDPIKGKGSDLRVLTPAQQPEVAAMMNFTLSRRFVASLALHEGAVVANYPWDGYDDGSEEVKKLVHATPDDASFRLLATSYAQLHANMADSKQYPGGITNGAQWYPLYGGSQDWNYVAAQCMEVTLELNDDKFPNAGRLASMWTENAQALLEWPLQTVLTGVRGRVVQAGSGKQARPLGAAISIKESRADFTSNPATGHFARPLAPGTYTLEVQAAGYTPFTTQITVPKDGSGVELTAELQPQNGKHQQGAAAGAPGTQVVDANGDALDTTDDTRDQGQQEQPQEQADEGTQAEAVRVVDTKDQAGSSSQGGVGMSGWWVWGLAVGLPLTLAAAYFLLWRRQQQAGAGAFPRPPGYQLVPRTLGRPPANGV